MFSVQRQLPKNTVLEVAYNGNHSTRLPIIADYNQAAPNPAGQTIPYTQRVPIPTFGPITWLDPAGIKHYNGLSARLERRFSKGLYILNSFPGERPGRFLSRRSILRRLLPGESPEYFQPGGGKRAVEFRRETE